MVWVYGSLTKPGRFHEGSDIDLALECEPPGGVLKLMADLSERLGREVEVALLPETRLAGSIRREDERWIA